MENIKMQRLKDIVDRIKGRFDHPLNPWATIEWPMEFHREDEEMHISIWETELNFDEEIMSSQYDENNQKLLFEMEDYI